MSRDWEATFAGWGAAPGITAQTKSENAERAVRKAISASTKLGQKNIEVFVQGSYANRTNVREDSDVDVCVLYQREFFADYSMSKGIDVCSLGFYDGQYTYSEFKDDVQAALVAHFGQSSVTRGKKAFDVHANSYRIDSDVVPCFEHRRYLGTTASHWFISGTELRPDGGGRIVNWPRQNYTNGVAKNEVTARRFKALTRILKRLKNDMSVAGIETARSIPSYLLECLAFNVPDDALTKASYCSTVRYSLAHLWNQTRSIDACKEWGEVNELKYLFWIGQPWNVPQVNSFLQSAWDYIGFE